MTKHKFSDIPNSPPVDQVGVGDRISRVQSRSIKNETKMNGLRLILNMIDLTTLEGSDTDNKVIQLCTKAKNLHASVDDLPNVAAVCVYPSKVAVAVNALKGTGIGVASVATAFPSGQSSLEVKLADTQLALDGGASEIDMVISRGKFLEGNYEFVFNEIAAIKKLCGKKARLKVILETGEIGNLDSIRKASDIAIYAGADFIKTSTGKIPRAASLPVTCVMLEAIRDYYHKTGIMIGMKPAGGISNSKLALQYIVLLKETLGDKWLSNEWFRFGASSLANDVLKQYVKQKTGAYQSGDYFSID
ncbi:MAG: deoxyribose-phosphate aldolase [Salibacteraceae bacterium]